MASAPIYNVVVPYVGRIENGFFPGKMVRIHGTVLPAANRFGINLQCGSHTVPRDDIALHISCRFPENSIVRNSLQSMSWGPEETFGPMPLQRGQSFEVLILCDPDHYKIAVNGLHFTEYIHRIPYQRVSHVAIDGEVTIAMISFEGGAPPTSGFAPPPGAPSYVPPPGPQSSVPYPPGGMGGAYPPPPTGAYPPAAGAYPPSAGAYPPGAGAYPPGAGAYPPGAGAYPPAAGAYPPGAGAYPPGAGAYPPGAGAYPPGAGAYPPGAGAYPQQPYGHPYPAGTAFTRAGVGAGMAGTAVGAGLAGAALSGHLSPKKAFKSQKKARKKALKYGLPLAGVGLGAYALSKGFHSGSSSSSSSSSEEE